MATLSYKEVKRRVLNTKYHLVIYKVMSTEYRWMSDVMNDTNIKDTEYTKEAVMVLWEVPTSGRYCDEVITTKRMSEDEARSIYKDIVKCTTMTEVKDILTAHKSN
jgi:hypothetical protein